jgi:hypothetical protein
MGAHRACRSDTGHVSSLPRLPPRPPEDDGDAPRPAYLFVREGEYWTVTFDGRVGRFRHARGFQHLARLLSDPGSPITASALASGDDPGERQVSPSSSSMTTERARSAVTKTIKAAIRRLGTQDAALGFYLGATIKTGVRCVYTPDPERRIRWVVEDPSTGS